MLNNQHIHWKTAVLFSAILPTLNLINNSQQREFHEWHRIAGNWTLTFLFLMCSWVINAVLFQRMEKGRVGFSIKPVLSIVLVNGFFLTVFVLLALFILNDFESAFSSGRRNLYLIAFRGFISIVLIYFIQYTLYSSRRAQEVLMQNQLLKTENLRAQFEALRQQVNPHFLFNTLSTLRSMIHSGKGNAELFVLKLSEMYRLLLSKRDKDVVTLAEELEFLDNYWYMLDARYENLLSIETNIPESFKSMFVPTFTLQILVENCIKHNVVSQEHRLYIKLYQSGKDFLIVENNVQPKWSVGESSGLGLNNLMKRYAFLGVKEAVSIFTDDTVFRVKIKLLTHEYTAS